jgi:TatD DNase family protein
MKFLDAHTHVQMPAYDADREAVILRAREADVAMVNVGTQAATSRAAIELAEKNENMWATVGFHPSHCNEAWHHDADEQASPTREIFDAEVFRKLAERPLVVAIGECGLDYYAAGGQRVVSDDDKKKQKEVFIAQIEIAKKVKKPLMIHCRDAFPDLIQILSTNYFLPTTNYFPGLIHFFTGTPAEAKALLDLGFAFTFGGAITFPPRKGQTAGAYDEIIKMLPLDRILSETDAPYVAPMSHRGQRNESAYVVEVVQKLAELKGISVERMAEAIWRNGERIFGLKQENQPLVGCG